MRMRGGVVVGAVAAIAVVAVVAVSTESLFFSS
jgi:hypothetical protein